MNTEDSRVDHNQRPDSPAVADTDRDIGSAQNVFHATYRKAIRHPWVLLLWCFTSTLLALVLWLSGEIGLAGVPVLIVIGTFPGLVLVVWEYLAFHSKNALRTVTLAEEGLNLELAGGTSDRAAWQDVSSYDRYTHKGYAEWSFVVGGKRIHLGSRAFSDQEWEEISAILQRRLLEAGVPRIGRHMVWMSRLGLCSLAAAPIAAIGLLAAGYDAFPAAGIAALFAAFAVGCAVVTFREKRSKFVAAISLILIMVCLYCCVRL